MEKQEQQEKLEKQDKQEKHDEQDEFGWSCRRFAELKTSVDMLAVRQDKLMDLMESHFHHLVGKLQETVNVFDPAARSSADSSRVVAGGADVEKVQSELSLNPDSTGIKSFKSCVSAGHGSKKPVLTKQPSGMSGMTELSSEFVEPQLTTNADPASNLDAFNSAAEGSPVRQIVRQCVQTKAFEAVSCAIIFFHMASLFMQLHWRSCESAQSIGHTKENCDWASVSFVFELLEYGFNFWYLAEVLLRLSAHRWEFFYDRINLADASIVVVSFLQYASHQVRFFGLAPLRFFRILRAMRVVRIIRLLVAFRELHILIKTLSASFRSLQWSLCVVGAIVWSSGLLVMQLVDAYLHDATQDLEVRQEMYLLYGTPLRAVYSMFVATFSTMWVPMARSMIEHVNPALGFFWVLYVVAVNFAVIRVIAAIFLKQTMDVASSDAERRAMEGQNQKERFARVLHDIFKLADTSGDGLISREEFEAMTRSRRVMRAFESLGLEPEEVVALFEVMSSDDGHADYDEFLKGALQMKSSARTFDAIRIMHELGSLMRVVHSVDRRLGIMELKAMPMSKNVGGLTRGATCVPALHS